MVATIIVAKILIGILALTIIMSCIEFFRLEKDDRKDKNERFR